MNTNLPQKYNSGFFNKLKSFFSKFFHNEMISEDAKIIEKEKNSNNSIEEMRKNSEYNKLKEDIIKLVERNPHVIENLSEERLDELDKMCDEKIKENSKKIEELKIKYERLQEKLA